MIVCDCYSKLILQEEGRRSLPERPVTGMLLLLLLPLQLLLLLLAEQLSEEKRLI
jgi:hypothetical protein